MIIIGLGHKSRQGKDTFATFLISYLRMNSKNKKIVKMGFADHLKSICYQLYSWAGLKQKDYYETNLEERGKVLPLIKRTPVQLWIDLGNHMRQFDPDIWMRALMKGTQADVLIIPDVRFPNEAQAIKDHNGHVFKIERPGFLGLDSISDNALNDYAEWTRIIPNDKTLRELNEHAEIIAKTYCKDIL